jgi:hypothetical protein
VGQSAGVWTPAFRDEFDGSVLDSAKWLDHLCEGDWYRTNDGGSEVEWYPHNQAGISFASSCILLTARYEDPRSSGSIGYDPLCPTPLPGGQTPQYTSGMFQSQPGFSAPFAYVETRCRMSDLAGNHRSDQDGPWPAFWSISQDAFWPPEIDGFDYFGGNGFNANWFTEPGAGGQDTGTVIVVGDMSQWHTYAYSWSPGGIVWYVDGVVRKTYSGTILVRPWHIIFNLAIESGSNSTNFPKVVSIDYVRAWTPVGVPLPPASITATGGTGQASVSFSTVSGATQYQALAIIVDGHADGVATSRSTAPQPTLGTSSPLIVTNLHAGARWQFVVCAQNATGWSKSSVLSNIVIPS